MKTEERKMVRRLFERSAEANGVTVFEVRNRFAQGIQAARERLGDDTEDAWGNIPHAGEDPTPEEVLLYLLRRIEAFR